MTIIAIATSKGGSGKTTLAMCLADHWTREGVSIECLDTDPNKNLSTWMNQAGSEIPCRFIGEDDVVDAAFEANARANAVLIDVAGSLTRGLIHAIGVADLVVIPAQPSLMDVAEAARMRGHILQTQRTVRRTILHTAILTRTQPRTVVAAHSRQQLADLSVPTLDVEVPNRTAYERASYLGMPLDNAAVRDDILAVVSEITELLEKHVGEVQAEPYEVKGAR